MPDCRNCGSFVTQRYVRVFQPSSLDGPGPRCCPHCADKIRDGSAVRDARSNRQAARGVPNDER